MAALITYEITTQNFEKVRDRIAIIIAEEFAGQKAITGNELFDAGVWIERSIPFDLPELPSINVMFAGANYDNTNALTSTGANRYLIDVHSNAKDEENTNGDKLAILKLHKLIGVIRFIMQSDEHYDFGFDPKIIQNNHKIENTSIAKPSNIGDGYHNAIGRLTLNAKFNESVAAGTGITIDEINSTFKIDETEKGFLVIQN